MSRLRLFPIALVLAIACESPANPPAQQAGVQPAAIPFTLKFTPVTWSGPRLPALQSYTWGSWNGIWIVFGGRINQGLHHFGQTGQNFPVDSTNRYLWVIDPMAQTVDSFLLTRLPDSLWPALTSDNQNFWMDRTRNILYTTGGYGWTADSSTMTTFGQITAVDVPGVINAVRQKASPAKVAACFRMRRDARFAVTGAVLDNIGGTFILPFGQYFDGQYRAFGPSAAESSSGKPFTQRYTNQIALFTLNPRDSTPTVLAYTALTSADTAQPYHRRDGNFVDDVDPATGTLRLAGFGGVFPPGVIGAYDDAVYVTGQAATVDTALHQRFNAYEAPVIPLWDSAGRATYHAFFGGISGTYYFQSSEEDSAYRVVTKQGRNDGLPFVADISVLVNRADSAPQYREWILPVPTTSDTALVGASGAFIPSHKLFTGQVMTDNGVIRLDRIGPGKSIPIGWVYGGIQAQNPLPLEPSTGTAATNLLMGVTLTRTPMGAIPASAGNSAKPPYSPYPHH
ncbi:MAG TPA: hypothetical protein VFL95_05355 [Gemmatimonadales bacterium]|nr:hypothetical protein [Gemmatimonadales bacterium]